MEPSDLTADVALIESIAAREARAVERPYLVMLSGLPGAGKSSLCRKLRERLPVAVIESDAVRAALFSPPTFSPAESERLFAVCFQAMERLLHRSLAVVMDATNLRERHRQPVYGIAERCGVPLVIVHVDAPPEVVRQRLQQRVSAAGEDSPSVAGWDVYRRMWYTRERIGRSYLYVDTARGIEEAAAKVLAAIEDAVRWDGRSLPPSEG